MVIVFIFFSLGPLNGRGFLPKRVFFSRSNALGFMPRPSGNATASPSFESDDNTFFEVGSWMSLGLSELLELVIQEMLKFNPHIKRNTDGSFAVAGALPDQFLVFTLISDAAASD